MMLMRFDRFWGLTSVLVLRLGVSHSTWVGLEYRASRSAMHARASSPEGRDVVSPASHPETECEHRPARDYAAPLC